MLTDFKALDLRFSNSKFILTSRPLDPWLASCKIAIEELYPHERLQPGSKFYDQMIRNRCARYGSLSYNEDTLIEKYYQHHADIIFHFKGRMEKLLIIDLTSSRDNWRPLCNFLNKPTPSIPFPRIS